MSDLKVRRPQGRGRRYVDVALRAWLFLLCCWAMSVIDEVLAANEVYSRTHELRRLAPRPEREVGGVAGMGTRRSICKVGVEKGEGDIICHAGGIVAEGRL